MAMKVNHLNLTVTDPVETQQFLVKHFGLKQRGKGNQNMALLSDDNGMVLTLMNMKIGRESEVKYPATFHIGFIQDSEEQVNEINRRLKADAFDVPPPSRQHGSWTFYFDAPGGFTHRGHGLIAALYETGWKTILHCSRECRAMIREHLKAPSRTECDEATAP
jgi:lactoylglutathione lyase